MSAVDKGTRSTLAPGAPAHLLEPHWLRSGTDVKSYFITISPPLRCFDDADSIVLPAEELFKRQAANRRRKSLVLVSSLLGFNLCLTGNFYSVILGIKAAGCPLNIAKRSKFQ